MRSPLTIYRSLYMRKDKNELGALSLCTTSKTLTGLRSPLATKSRRIMLIHGDYMQVYSTRYAFLGPLFDALVVHV